MFSTIASFFRSTSNLAHMVEEATEQGLDEVKALRASRQLTNQAELALLTKEYADAGLGELTTSNSNPKAK